MANSFQFTKAYFIRSLFTATLVLSIVFTSCGIGPGTMPKHISLPIDYEKLPELTREHNVDISSIKRIAVMPFKADTSFQVDSSHNVEEVTSYATANVASAFSKMPNITLVDTSEIKRLKASGQSLENYVDAILYGNLEKYEESKGSRKDQRLVLDPGTDALIYYETFHGKVSYNYSLVITKDDRTAGPFSGTSTRTQSFEISKSKYYTISEGSYQKTLCDYFSLFSLCKGAISYLGEYISDEFKLSKDTYNLRIYSKKDSIASEEMEKAFSYIEPGVFVNTRPIIYLCLIFGPSCKNYDVTPSKENAKRALKAYLEIYEHYKYIEAALNATALYEYLEGQEVALNYIQKVYEETEDPQAKRRMEDINEYLKKKAKVATFH